MIYTIICTLLRWYMRFFYPNVYVLRKENIPRDKPYILVCNHQNSFMDAFVLAIHFDTPLFFIKPLAKKLYYFQNLLMRSLHIVPLQKRWHRNKESREVNPSIKLRNLIAHNHPLVFFSENKQDRIKVTKGAAKIAFHTEEVFDFGLNVEIIPVTLHYGPEGDAVIVLGQSVPVGAFERDYKKYPARTIKYTTQYLESELLQDSLHEHTKIARLLGHFQQILKRKSPGDASPELLNRVVNPVSDVLGNKHPLMLKERLMYFFSLLKQNHLSDWYPRKPQPMHYLLVLIGGPLFVVGYIFNQLRFHLSQWLVLLFLPRLGHTDASRMIVGLFLFPLIWLMISAGVYLFTRQVSYALVSMLILPLLAQFTFYYWKKITSLFSYLRYRYFIRFRAGQARRIEQTYAEVLYLLRKSVPAQVISA